VPPYNNFSTELEPREGVMSQTSFDHISINSSMILTVSMAMESPQNDLLIDASHISRQSILVEILGRSMVTTIVLFIKSLISWKLPQSMLQFWAYQKPSSYFSE